MKQFLEDLDSVLEIDHGEGHKTGAWKVIAVGSHLLPSGLPLCIAESRSVHDRIVYGSSSEDINGILGLLIFLSIVGHRLRDLIKPSLSYRFISTRSSFQSVSI